MKKLINKIFIFPLLASVLITGCSKDSFLDVNKDPNRVTGDNITPYLIFPAAADGVGRRQFGNYDFLQQWMGYYSGDGNFVPDNVITTYNTDNTFGDNLWINNYNTLFDLEQTRSKAFAAGDSALGCASMVLSAQLFQNLVDVFGDIPYTQAFNNVNYPTPAYDSATFIYRSLQGKLDTAIAYLSTGKASSAFTACDKINSGDLTKWVKYANTLKLRLLIRQSQVNGFDPTADIAKIKANGGVLHAGETISVNVGYANSTNQISPFYSSYGVDATGADANPGERGNKYLITLLSTSNDPRLTYFYAPVNGSVVGCTLGGPVNSPSDPTTNPIGNNSSKFGSGLLKSPTQSQWIMTSVESMFLEAEAIARGWLPGDAKTAYQAAVTESFNWLGVSNYASAAATYLTSNIANWDAPPAYFTSKPQFIAYQKYIALCGINPLETWSDYRRLNMIPDKGYISVNPAKISNVIPIRLKYPQSEYTSNGNNVGVKGNIDPFSTKLFWQP